MISSTKLIRFLKHKIVLLDTNIFRDILSKPTILSEFLEKLKSSGITLGTIDAVKYELLKGSSDENKYKERAKFIDKTIDITINLPPSSFELVYDLILKCNIDGASLNITDLLLGTALMIYKKNICLVTRDTNDFSQKIFDLRSIVNIPHSRGILTYGIYQYKLN
ncbi:hypothetical protein A3A93_00855 [Candidatus Roizmanbacteria bacterium RIFCSPLOWO2_01_FULL_38_12]|uniref:PIN domain-containing protein n=1 Tax=Candidatus Roizmanbacteria bacterium RIFCSPLOWO2_01_FULL_38_12 TaxID=1802061 RepID=A0A1F7IVL7_9BACT|nr:MAG: hypothetical protein A3F59_05880 [Candidatus Roizmanbacteria bacterium RIFCSPHIGHO2_12_FULL_38_13]OGK47406.1 MAG: hypothetical protein A3A93_00855 [Candidatus Roizmanbacteria bacterium RIFCSPLOWO2_01_FULL_38_12]